MNEAANVRRTGERIETILAELRASASPATMERVGELLHQVLSLYGEGLSRVLDLLEPRGAPTPAKPTPDGSPNGGGGSDASGDGAGSATGRCANAPPGADADGVATPADAAAERLRARVLQDPLLTSLLLLHDLHPIPVEVRVQQALEKVRPYLGSHAGGVELLGIDEEGVVRLRLQGSCHGCPSSLVTVKLAIERAIDEAAPEVARIDVDGIARDAAAAAAAGRAPESSASPSSFPMLREGSLPSCEGAARSGGATAGPAWQRVTGLTSLASGRTAAIEVDGISLLICRSGEHLFAYGDACASCAGPLGGGPLEGDLLTCPRCGETYDVRRAGRSARGPAGRHLLPFPLLPAGVDAVEIAVSPALAVPPRASIAGPLGADVR